MSEGWRKYTNPIKKHYVKEHGSPGAEVATDQNVHIVTEMSIAVRKLLGRMKEEAKKPITRKFTEFVEDSITVLNRYHEIMREASSTEIYGVLMDFAEHLRGYMGSLRKYIDECMNSDDDEKKEKCADLLERQIGRFVDIVRTITALQEKGTIAARQSGNIVNVVGSGTPKEGNGNMGFFEAFRRVGGGGPVPDTRQIEQEARSVDSERRPD